MTGWEVDPGKWEITQGVQGATADAPLPPGLDPTLPVLLVNRAEPGTAPSVTVDDETGSRIATEYLISLGHRRIAHAAQRRLAERVVERGSQRPAHFLRAAAPERHGGRLRNLPGGERRLLPLGDRRGSSRRDDWTGTRWRGIPGRETSGHQGRRRRSGGWVLRRRAFWLRAGARRLRAGARRLRAGARRLRGGTGRLRWSGCGRSRGGGRSGGCAAHWCPAVPRRLRVA